MTSDTFRDLLGEPGCAVGPAGYDALSARIAERLGFRAVGLGGLLVAASRLGGLPEYEALERRYAEGDDPPSS